MFKELDPRPGITSMPDNSRCLPVHQAQIIFRARGTKRNYEPCRRLTYFHCSRCRRRAGGAIILLRRMASLFTGLTSSFTTTFGVRPGRRSADSPLNCPIVEEVAPRSLDNVLVDVQRLIGQEAVLILQMLPVVPPPLPCRSISSCLMATNRPPSSTTSHKYRRPSSASCAVR